MSPIDTDFIKFLFFFILAAAFIAGLFLFLFEIPEYLRIKNTERIFSNEENFFQCKNGHFDDIKKVGNSFLCFDVVKHSLGCQRGGFHINFMAFDRGGIGFYVFENIVPFSVNLQNRQTVVVLVVNRSFSGGLVYKSKSIILRPGKILKELQRAYKYENFCDDITFLHENKVDFDFLRNLFCCVKNDFDFMQIHANMICLYSYRKILNPNDIRRVIDEIEGDFSKIAG